MATEDLVWTVEEACQNAWPSPRQVLLEGWLLRASGGETRRTNSVNPLRSGPRDPTAIITSVGEIYGSLGQAAIFRVPSIVPEMERPLDRQGYVAQAETCTLFTELDDDYQAGLAEVEMSADPSEEWFSARAVGSTLTESVYREMIRAIVLPKVFVARRIEGKLVACAYGVLHHKMLVIESVVTHLEHRQQGHGRHVIGHLLGWAKKNDAAGGCLQVVADNVPACALYRSLGFRKELYRYHYRCQPLGSN